MHGTSLAKVLGALVIVASAGSANAQTAAGNQYPNKPIRVVTPGPGGLDTIARRFMGTVVEALGQNVVIENKPSGVIPGLTVKLATPDGYTLLFTGGPHWLTPMLQSNAPYDAVKDFAAISMVYIQPYILLVGAKMPVNSVSELIALAKQRPGQINMGAGSPGSSGSLSGTIFRELAGVDLVVVPYKSGNDRATALLAGEISVDFLSGASTKAVINSGKVKALGISSQRPSAQFPGVPPISETVPGFEYGSTAILFAPAKTPKPVINRLNQEVNRALKDAETIKMLVQYSADPTGGSPETAIEFVKSDMARMAKLVKSGAVTPQSFQ